MRSAITPLIYCIGLLQTALGFAEPMPLANQVRQADAILRVVVVAYDILKINENSGGFQAIAKCRVIEDYKGDYKQGHFIYIPCAYNFDENPSPIDAEGDYVVFLDVLETAPIGHPVAYNAVYPIERGQMDDPEAHGKELAVVDFVKRFSCMLRTPAEQSGADQPTASPESKPKGMEKASH